VKRGQNDPFLNDQTRQIWMHGDLHAANFGTYMDSRGHLVFSVNDFDEAYVGPFLWDLKRFVASIALIGYAKALSDQQITRLVKEYAKAYRKCIHLLAVSTAVQKDVPKFTLDTAEGPVLEALRSARMKSRVEMLDSTTEIRNYERRFTQGGGAIKLDEATREKVVSAFMEYTKTLTDVGPRGRDSRRVKDVVGRRGIGIGSAGLPSYNILLEGSSEALENDVIVFMKQSQPAAISQQIKHNVAQDHFLHEGHRTVLSQRALQTDADPWLGWTELDGKGQLVAEVSPYAVDMEWSEINKFEEIKKVVSDLGRATAMMHGAGDDDERHSDLVPFAPENAIDEAIAAHEEQFEGTLEDFAMEYGAQARQDHHIFVELFRNGRIPGLGDNGDDKKIE
jgi:uncharacterized protein (DUF2252 family)